MAYDSVLLDQARKLMTAAFNPSRGIDTRTQAYAQVTSRFLPVFRYFFLEQFRDPTAWAACRLAYTRSVAVTSMVGYVLGIGDRHTSNILLDTNTAEVVHIDFGIMFEQGRALAMPETVPFRLTRDVVDGFGVAGLDGTFRCCCAWIFVAAF